MNTTELRQSFQRIHAYQDWQRQCEALADEIDRLEQLIAFGVDMRIALAQEKDDEIDRLRTALGDIRVITALVVGINKPVDRIAEICDTVLGQPAAPTRSYEE